jgi:hypothetical protein
MGLGGLLAAPGRAVDPPAAPPAMFTPNVRADAAEDGSGQNEPQVIVDQAGVTYVAWQSSTLPGASSAVARTNDGFNFTDDRNPDVANAGIGDVALATTSWTSPTETVPVGPAGSQAVMFSELGAAQDPTCPQGAINILATYSTDQGGSWTPNDATCQSLQVDRNWMAAYTEPAFRGTPQAQDHTWVYQTYHDFGISMMWLTVSSDGGKTWDTLNQHPAEQVGLPLLQNGCNTTPGSIAVDQRGSHAGRIYITWTSSDLVRNLTQGCNITEAEPFDHVYLSYSDDHGSTWQTRTVWNDPCSPSPPLPPTNPLECADDQDIFPPVAVDDAGNVFVAFVDMPDSLTAPAAPEFDIGVAWSTDGGDTWSGGTPDNPGTPRIANTGHGTHYFPWITAAGNGAVDVAWYGTPYAAGLSTQQKPSPAPDSAVWNVYMGQSLDVLNGAPFTESKVSDHDMYFGDICTVGIFCDRILGPTVLGTGGDRILLDNLGIAIGPDGGARVAWTDTRDSWSDTCKPGAADNSTAPCQAQHLYFSCQQGGVGLHGETVRGCGRSAPASAPAPGPTPTILPSTSAGGGTIAWLMMLPLALLLLGGRRRGRSSAGA